MALSPSFILSSKSAVGTMALHEDSETGVEILITAASTTNQIEIWNMKKRRVSRTVSGCFGDPPGILSVHPVGSKLYVWTRSARFLEFSLENLDEAPIALHLTEYVGFCRSNVKGPSGDEPGGLALVPSLAKDWHGVDVLSLAGKVLNRCYAKNHGTPMASTFISKDKFAVSYESGIVGLYTTSQRNPLSVTQVAAPGIPIMALQSSVPINDQPQCLLAGTAENTLYKLDENLHERDKQTLTNAGLNAIIPTDESNIVLTLGWDKRIRVFDAGQKISEKLTPLAVINCDQYLHQESLQCGAFSKSNGTLYTASLDGRICGWKNFVGKFKPEKS